MTWFKVDDSFHSHPKVLAASPAALGLWVVAGSWSGDNPTNGFVADHVLQRLLPDAATLAKELVAVGLWKRQRGGYQFHDWSDYQPTREEAAAGKQKMSAAGALGNHRRWHAAAGKADPDCRYCQDAEPDRVGRSRDLPVTKNRPTNGSGSPKKDPVDNRGRNAGSAPDQGVSPSGTRSGSDRVSESPPSPPVPSRPGPIGGRPSYVGPGGARDELPPPQCPEHINDPSPPPCGACGDHRRARAAAEVERARRQAEAPHCRRHRGQLAASCGPCRSEQLAPPEEPS